ncbi:MAG TPA: DUF2520 domain-containing protein [Candidatus Dormibacteraeota bacterium]|jgi:predicted short-subunit dehydrogenase-like oxidoreductase (DUF2520 family)|nr:DUF2520 domain-containing protein [Candidatus Dormibacteraeota bacterium]
MSTSLSAIARTVTVLGRGRVGRSLAGALHAAGRPAHLEPARGWRTSRGQGRAGTALRGLVFLAVPDQALEPLAREIAVDLPEAVAAFVHLSGALELEVLAPLAERGCAVGSFHPLQPFPVERPPEAFRGSLVAVDASEPGLREELEGLARLVGARPLPAVRGRRALYHAGAAMAANLTVALAAQSQSVFEAVGWGEPEARAAVLSLMRGALETVAEVGLPAGLSGPIRRGEVDTVARHLAALETVPGSDAVRPVDVYRILGLAALDLAAAGGLEAAAASRLTALLAGQGRGEGAKP